MPAWWSGAIVYQIYPRSFRDSNGDGVGDLPGISSKLDYLADLGINTIWLCPVFDSPMVDNGYDVSDYEAIYPAFGTMEDMENLVREAGARGIRILLDLVVNHTSNKHPWFLSAVSDPASPYRDFYIFREGKNGRPPNNWRSLFGGPVWEPVPGGDNRFYYHTFAVEQPDLNWENPKMRETLYAMIRRWLDKGAAGFRIDAIVYIKKEQTFPDAPVNGPDGLGSLDPWSRMYPGIEEFLREMRGKAFRGSDVFTVAEAMGIQEHHLESFIGKDGFFSTYFDFTHIELDIENGEWYLLKDVPPGKLRDTLYEVQKKICKAGYAAPYFENHDQNRSPDKFLKAGERTREGKTLLGTLFFFLRGIPFIYQGQELGMTNYPWKSMDEFNDVNTIDQYKRCRARGFTEEQAFKIAAQRSRDNARIPMLWDASPAAGFTSGKPWLPIHPDYKELNAENQARDGASVLAFYKKMIRLRKDHNDLFFKGEINPLPAGDDQLFVYERKHGGERALVLGNFADVPKTVDLRKTGTDSPGLVWLGNLRPSGTAVNGKITLEPKEALVVGTVG
jgi:alpha-glucosidase